VAVVRAAGMLVSARVQEQYVHRPMEGGCRSMHEKSPDFRGFPSAPERTRTSTDHTVHKALNPVARV